MVLVKTPQTHEWDNLSLHADSQNLTDTSRLKSDVHAAYDYIRNAREQRKLSAHGDYNRHCYRYKIGRVLAEIPEQRGGDRKTKAEDQSSKLGTLMPGEREIMDRYGKTERNRLRQLASIPVALFEARLAKAITENRPVSDAELMRFAKECAGKNYKIKLRQAFADADKALKASGEHARIKEWIQLEHCKLQELHKHLDVPPLDAIVCDPPYVREAIDAKLFADIAKFADKHLKPHAPLAIMVGQYWLPETISQIEKQGFGLRWSLAVTYNEESQVSQRRVHSHWKPILLFQRKADLVGIPPFRNLRTDLIVAGQKNKDFNEWQQDPETFETLLNLLCEPDSMICDPCAGWGTTAIACLRQRMKFIGCEMLKDRYDDAWGLIELEWRRIHGGRNNQEGSTELGLSVKPKGLLGGKKASGAQTVSTANQKSNGGTVAKTTDNMYKDADVWNPFYGCKFDCSYCEPSFKRQAKRQKGNCLSCYKYEPHQHPERLKIGEFPNAKIVFVCGYSDIAFCPPDFMREIIEAVKNRSAKHPEQIFYFQSKRCKRRSKSVAGSRA